MNKFNILILIFFLFIINGSQIDVFGQNKFKAAFVGGFTAAKLGGDSISGYDKLGITLGAKLGYPLNERLELNFELLYSQRGSRKNLGFSNSGDDVTFLNYLEIPVYVTFNDWKVEKGNYYKVGIFGGLSYGYLINATSTNNLLQGREGEFNQSDISARVGVYYSFSKSLTFRTYYTDSFVKLVEGNLFNTESLDSFFWTFRLEYNF